MSYNRNMADKTPKELEEEQALQNVNEKLEKFLGEPIDDEPEVKADPPEEKPTETIVDPPKEEEKKEEVTVPPVDTEKLKEEMTKEITETIVERITGKKEENLEEKSPWEKEGRDPKDWNEVVKWSTEQAKKAVQLELEEKEKALKEQEEKNKVNQEEYTKKANEYWDNQINDLTTSGKVSKEELKDFWQQVLDVNTQLAEEGKPHIVSLTDFYLFHYKPKTKEVAGARAPVMGGKAKVTPQEDDDDDYMTLHRTPMRNLIHRK